MERRRQDERITINKEFESFDSFIQEYVTNISRSGVFIKSRQPLPVGTRVNLRFTVIMDDIETIEGTGKVVRVETSPAGPAPISPPAVCQIPSGGSAGYGAVRRL